MKVILQGEIKDAVKALQLEGGLINAQAACLNLISGQNTLQLWKKKGESDGYLLEFVLVSDPWAQ